MRQTTAVLYLLVITGCATTGGYEKNLQSWVGAHSDELVSSWGPPTRERPLSGGGQVLEYSRGGSSRQTLICHPSRPACFSNDVYLSCTTRFRTDSSGIITNWVWEGNDC